jgi:hypothetical protein
MWFNNISFDPLLCVFFKLDPKRLMEFDDAIALRSFNELATAAQKLVFNELCQLLSESPFPADQ